ncbi:hypothetical protein F0U47_13120 [Nocardioides antri]|uniref:Uncharacterized protein n=1 Tax=Nocardioides antri TaxID=2607659 RepID=A0A5B1M2N6_9ACTN|nr:hypothetical protein F0U47_13120 [Nocardioides antri]
MRRRPALVLLAALLLTLGTAGRAEAEPPPLPEDDPYFAAPADLPSYAAGELIRARPVTVKSFEVPVPADAWQVLFRTSDRRGTPTVSVTTVIVPRTEWRRGGERPLVSYQTAEDGVSTRCAPSYALSAGIAGGFTGSYSESSMVVSLLLKGWAVSVPDYEGMESQFLVADVAAKGVLDGLRAAQSSAAPASRTRRSGCGATQGAPSRPRTPPSCSRATRPSSTSTRSRWVASSAACARRSTRSRAASSAVRSRWGSTGSTAPMHGTSGPTSTPSAGVSTTPARTCASSRPCSDAPSWTSPTSRPSREPWTARRSPRCWRRTAR